MSRPRRRRAYVRAEACWRAASGAPRAWPRGEERRITCTRSTLFDEERRTISCTYTRRAEVYFSTRSQITRSAEVYFSTRSKLTRRAENAVLVAAARSDARASAIVLGSERLVLQRAWPTALPPRVAAPAAHASDAWRWFGCAAHQPRRRRRHLDPSCCVCLCSRRRRSNWMRIAMLVEEAFLLFACA